jgi:hypothetical protein
MAATVLIGLAMIAGLQQGVPAAPQGRNEALAPFAACRQVAEAAARLACFDRAAAELERAVAEQRIVILNRQDIRETRRSLFGLARPRLSLIEGETERAEERSEEIETVVARASQVSPGRWLVTLPDGAQWRMIETSSGMPEPRSGARVRIRKAALGSFLMNIDGQRGVRVRRER